VIGLVTAVMSAAAARVAQFWNQRTFDVRLEPANDTILVVGHAPLEDWFFDRPPADATVIVAADDVVARTGAMDAAVVDSVVHMSQMESYYSIADDALEISGIVNDWFDELQEHVGGLPEDLHFWHPDWGNARRIEKALLLVNSYVSLLESHEPDVVVYRKHHRHWLEWVVLESVLDKRGCESLPLEGFRTGALRRLGGDPKRSGFERLLHLPGLRLGRVLQRNLNQLGRVVRKRCGRLLNRPRGGQFPTSSSGQKLAFQLLTDSNRHISALITQMDEVRAVDGLKPVAPCWNSSDGAAQVTAQGMAAVELESLYPLTRVPTDLRRTVKVWRAVSKHVDSLSDRDLTYREVPLHEIIVPLVRRYTFHQTFESLSFYRGFEQYLAMESVTGLQAMGGGYHNQLGATTLSAAESLSDPFTFFYRGNPRYHYNPYFRDLNDHYFANGQKECERLIKQGIEQERFDTVGYTQFEKIREFATDHTQQDSVQQIGLGDEYDYTIFFAPQWVIPGRLTQQELSRVTTALVEFATEHESCRLLVKPHPNGHTSILETIFNHHARSDVELVDGAQEVLHCVNCADIVVTKFSTVGLEAIVCGKPLITVAIDEGGETFLTPYEEVAETFHDLDSIAAFLERLDSDTDHRRNWYHEQADRREQFFEENFVTQDTLGVALQRTLQERGLSKRSKNP